MSTKKVIYVGIVGRAYNGKDTFAEMLKNHLCEIGAVDVYIEHFANPLKDICNKVFLSEKEISKGEKIEKDKEYKISFNKSLKGREIFQKFGTEAMRDVFDEDIWIYRLFDRTKDLSSKTSIILIADVRFKNEAKWVRENGVLYKIRREGIEKMDHQSENEIDDIECDKCIDNNGTLQDLDNKAKEIAQDIYKLS